jgi:hypothetical protein
VKVPRRRGFGKSGKRQRLILSKPFSPATAKAAADLDG